MTTVGIISDVHADIGALHLALTRLEQCDKVICLGDVVDFGKNPSDVINTLRNHNIATVIGEHDQRIARVGPPTPYAPDEATKQISDDEKAWLAALPQIIAYDWDGIRVSMVHARPFDTKFNLFPNRPSEEFRVSIATSAHPEVLITGHTHVPMKVAYGKHLIVNPGSVYQNRNDVGRPPCERSVGLLTLPERTFVLIDIDSGEEVELPLNRRA